MNTLIWKAISIFILITQLFIYINVNEWETHSKLGFGELMFAVGSFLGIFLGISLIKAIGK
ncbi:MAG: hypothetical protein RBT65_03335 [Methanolobus sp.]|jgi:hypothetical protein|nr:hypothetical protein [Methanolobus sp.]